MKFVIKGPFKENIHSLGRKIGYNLQGEEGSELSFTRPPRGYPRFHLFLEKKADDLVFNLHLDQKRPSYKGSPAHAGEYDGEVVENEAERIKENLESLKK